VINLSDTARMEFSVRWRMSSDELARARNRRSYRRRKEGLRSWDIDLPDVATEEMIDALIYYGRLTAAEADDPDRVASEISAVGQALLLWWAERWRELDRGPDREISFIRVRRKPPDPER
jgi:hypothetical protein